MVAAGRTSHPVADAGEAWTQRVGRFTDVPALIRQFGADPATVLRHAGLAPGALDDPERRVPYAALGHVLALAAQSTRCPHFGLLCGRAWRLADLGLVGQAVRHSPTVGAALKALTHYQHLNGECGTAYQRENESTLEVGYAIYHPDVIGTEQILDAILAGGCNFLRELCGASWTAAEVLLPRAQPADVEPYRRHFRSRLRFHTEVGAIRMARSIASRPVEGANPALLQAASDAARHTQRRDDLVHRVFRVARMLLLSGKHSGDEVARLLHMHRRTLNRRLEERGTTYQQVLDEVRFAVARQLLADPGMEVDDVSAALGYASVSVFMRAFRRWSGVTPGQWRRACPIPAIA